MKLHDIKEDAANEVSKRSRNADRLTPSELGVNIKP